MSLYLRMARYKQGDIAIDIPKEGLNAVLFDNKRPLVLGIDPGLGGALALFDPKSRELVKLIPTPLIEGDGSKKELALNELALFFDEYADQISHCGIEEVHAMPGQGVVSMFNFGMGYGKLRGLLAANYIPTFRVKPQNWKQVFHLINKRKEWSLELARDLFPKNKADFARACDDGKAEAALIAVYASLYCGHGKTVHESTYGYNERNTNNPGDRSSTRKNK